MQGQQEAAISPVTVFYSYAHEDERLRRRLEKHLSLLRRQGMLAEWHDRKIVPGTDWAHTIDEHLTTASVILLLISPDFLASDYCYGVEMQRALERDAAGEAHIIPILVRPVDWEGAPFAHLHCLPSDAKPVTRWRNLDEAFVDVARGIRSALEDLSTSHRSPVLPTPRVSAAPQPGGHPSSEPKDPNRRRMLERVRSTWIKGVLEQSLHGAALIALGLREQPDVLANPWRLVVQEVGQTAHALPRGTPITQVYDDAEGALLILGEPGAGKTTLLLELTRDLLNRAQKDENLPIPVVFNLSSWARQQPPLTEWLVEELNIRYDVPRRLGQSWVTNNTLHLLLDGLDEVLPAARKQCIQAINRYREAHPFAPVVVCSRSDDYLDQSTQLRLHTAVIVQPLTQEQIDAYLVSAGAEVEALRVALRNDLDLQELAKTPLMLSILTLAYQGMPLDEITALGSLKATRWRVFDSYVLSMLKRRSAEMHYTPQQTMQWLAWLARRMKQQGQTVFYLERMQPDWLPEGRLSPIYERLAVRLPGMLIGVLICLVVNTLFLSPFNNMIFYIIFGLIGVLLGGLFSGRIIAKLSSGIRLESWRISRFHFILGHLRNELLIGLGIGLSFGLIFELRNWLSFGLIFGLIGILLSEILVGKDRTIQPREIIIWSWRSFSQSLINAGHMRNTLLVGVLGGLSRGLGRMPSDVPSVVPSVGLNGELSAGMSVGLSVGLSYWLLLGLFNGLSSDALDERRRIVPNQGIRRSARNSILVGLISGLVSSPIVILSYGLSYGLLRGLSGGLIGWLSYGLSHGLIYVLIVGLAGGLLAGLLSGGLACIQHSVLLWLLWRSGFIPWNYVRFLDFAAERILLRKVGGGYIFVHRLLLDYFTTLDAPAAI